MKSNICFGITPSSAQVLLTNWYLRSFLAVLRGTCGVEIDPGLPACKHMFNYQVITLALKLKLRRTSCFRFSCFTSETKLLSFKQELTRTSRFRDIDGNWYPEKNTFILETIEYRNTIHGFKRKNMQLTYFTMKKHQRGISFHLGNQLKILVAVLGNNSTLVIAHAYQCLT